MLATNYSADALAGVREKTANLHEVTHRAPLIGAAWEIECLITDALETQAREEVAPRG